MGAGQEVMREDKDDFYSYLCSSTLVSPWHARGPATANTKNNCLCFFNLVTRCMYRYLQRCVYVHVYAVVEY